MQTSWQFYLCHVYFESVRCEGHAAEWLVRVLVFPGLPILPDVAQAHHEHHPLRLPRAHAAQALGQWGAVHQCTLGTVAEVDGHLHFSWDLCHHHNIPHLRVLLVSLVTGVHLRPGLAASLEVLRAGRVVLAVAEGVGPGEDGGAVHWGKLLAVQIPIIWSVYQLSSCLNNTSKACYWRHCKASQCLSPLHTVTTCNWENGDIIRIILSILVSPQDICV